MPSTTHCLVRGLLIASCAFFASAATAQTCIEAPLGMHGWWPGDGDSVDLQTGLHAVAVNGAGYGPGLVGDAFDFNGFDQGQDDRVDLPPSALQGLGDVTIEMWVLSDGDEGAFFSGAGPTVPNQATDNEILLLHGVGGGLAIVQQQHSGNFPSFWTDGDWHHLAYIRSGGVGMIYVDAVMVDARAVPTRPFDIGPGGLLLGQEQDCLGGCTEAHQALDGMVDELAIYDRALAQEELAAIFEAGAAGKCKPPSRDDLLQEVGDLQMGMVDLEAELFGLDSEVVVLESEIVGLESEVGTLLGRIAELEASQVEAPPQGCEHSYRRRGCERGEGHDDTRRRRHGWRGRH
jgi:hypothetical protein